MATINVPVPDELKAQFEQIANERKQPMAAIIREYIARLVKREQDKAQKEKSN